MRMWQENEVTRILKTTVPIIQAGMAGGITTPELVAAISNEGGLGCIGAGYLTSTELEDQIREVKKRTNQPFAVNVFVPQDFSSSIQEQVDAESWLQPFRSQLGLDTEEHVRVPTADELQQRFEQQIDCVIKENVNVCSFTFGIPKPSIIHRLKQAQIVLIGTATTVQEAIEVEKSGMDIVVMQGSEAGGHRGTFNSPVQEAMIGTMALVPQAVDRVTIPVVAAGGIADSRGILAALILGAQGVQMGTVFLTTVESGAAPSYQQAIRNSTEQDVVVTAAFSGKAARGIRNPFIEQMSRYEENLPPYPIQHYLTQPIRKAAAKQHLSEYQSLWCGQYPLSNQGKTVKDVLTTLFTGLEQLRQQLSI